MRTDKILVVNDDGPKSPMIVPFLDELKRHSPRFELRPVFPAEEQSWIAQAITRFKPLFAYEHFFGSQLFNSHPGYLVSGTPADCVGLGIGNLYPEPADFVFSGINLGVNAGLPFYLNSGTVGGARQAFLYGIRAIAISVLVPDNVFSAWRSQNIEAIQGFHADWQRIAHNAVLLSQRLMHDEAWTACDFFSINMPWEINEKTEVKITKLEPMRYKTFYQKTEQGYYTHKFQGFVPPESAQLQSQSQAELDMTMVLNGKIAITPIKYDLFPRDKSAIEFLHEQFVS